MGNFFRMRVRIREMREERGLTQEQLAERIGTNAGYLSKMERGIRRTNTEWLHKIALEFGCDPSELVAKVTRKRTHEVQLVMVTGRVQAGVFGASYQLDEEERYEIESPKVTDDKRVFALEVIGPSMNKFLADGSIAVCVPLLDCADLQDEDFVVCERIRHDGEREATIKQYAMDKQGRPWLMPRSEDPAFQAGIALDPDLWTEAERREIKEVRVTALVEGGFTRLSRRHRSRF